MVAKSSGSSSRKASWPRSVSISTKETLAAAAFSACTMVRFSGVGNSQSEVKETTQKRVLRAAKGVGEHAAIVEREVEIVHRARHVEIGVGVEAADEGRALVAEIGLHLEIRVEAEGELGAVLQLPPELSVQRLVGHVGDVRGHARDREALSRALAELGIFSAAPVGVGHHRLPADFVEGDVLRRMPRGAGDRHGGEDALRKARRPLQHLHAAHRAAEHAEQRVDAEPVDQHRLRAHHVADGDDGKVEAVGLPVFGSIEAGPVVPMQPPSTLAQMTK